MNFADLLKKEEQDNYDISYTENGAVGFSTTGKALLDLNFSVASLRSMSDSAVIQKFDNAYFENPALAITWLFYARDIREGLGERRLFRLCFRSLFERRRIDVTKSTKELQDFLMLIAEYGRWDDLYSLVGISTVIDTIVSNIFKVQLDTDILSMNAGKSVSLLAKWLKSESASSIESRKLAAWTMTRLEMSPKQYRQTLSKLRKYIDVTEVKMCANNWADIKYETVPSKANLNYADAFLRHDEARYLEYIDKVNSGETKINSAVLYPYEILQEYKNKKGAWYYSQISELDPSLEALWKNLPDLVQGDANTLVVSDGSGSMTSAIGSGKTTALTVAQSLAIYFAEKAKGPYANKYITFSSKPKFVDFSGCKTLMDKINYCSQFNECSNTDIEKVFNLILDTAINNNCSQEDMPKNILILSDMEFDYCAENARANLFRAIEESYKRAGYQLPRLIFWNLNSRTGTIPVKENDRGVTLVSGFSINILKMVMDNELDPYKLLLKILMSDRYKEIYNLFNC